MQIIVVLTLQLWLLDITGLRSDLSGRLMRAHRLSPNLFFYHITNLFSTMLLEVMLSYVSVIDGFFF